MTPYTVIGGYLGAGKTTLIRHLLEHPEGQRLGLLINDFGAINIDAALISNANHNTVELTNGCICCSLSDGFDEALSTLLDFNPRPDHVLVEASGVADVRTLAQYGHHPGLSLSGIIVVIDSETICQQAEDRYVGNTVLRHLLAADLILANKQDLISEQERKDLGLWLSEKSPQSLIWPAQQAALPIEIALGVESRAQEQSMPQLDHASSEYAFAHPTFARWVWQMPYAVTRQALEGFLNHLPSSVIRLKGLIDSDQGVLEIQVVGARRTLRKRSDIQHEGQQLVAIGLNPHFDAESLDRLANDWLASITQA